MSTIHSLAGVVCAARFTTVDDVGDRVQARNGNAAARLEAFPVGMRMRVEEPRQNRTACEVDELRRRSGILEQRRVVADGGDVPGRTANGLRDPGRAVEGDDLAAVQNQIGRKHQEPVGCESYN